MFLLDSHWSSLTIASQLLLPTPDWLTRVHFPRVTSHPLFSFADSQSLIAPHTLFCHPTYDCLVVSFYFSNSIIIIFGSARVFLLDTHWSSLTLASQLFLPAPHWSTRVHFPRIASHPLLSLAECRSLICWLTISHFFFSNSIRLIYGDAQAFLLASHWSSLTLTYHLFITASGWLTRALTTRHHLSPLAVAVCPHTYDCWLVILRFVCSSQSRKSEFQPLIGRRTIAILFWHPTYDCFVVNSYFPIQ